jgi:hypothetical protein
MVLVDLSYGEYLAIYGNRCLCEIALHGPRLLISQTKAFSVARWPYDESALRADFWCRCRPDLLVDVTETAAAMHREDPRHRGQQFFSRANGAVSQRGTTVCAAATIYSNVSLKPTLCRLFDE